MGFFDVSSHTQAAFRTQTTDSESRGRTEKALDGLFQLGRLLLAAAMAVFGTGYCIYASSLHWPVPGPPWTPGGHVSAAIAGVVLIAIGLSLASEVKARLAATVLGLLLILRVLFLHLPELLRAVRNPDKWTGAAEVLAMGGAALVLAGGLKEWPDFAGWSSGTAVKIGRYLFALPLFIFGTQHFMYGPFIAGLVPRWIPGHLFWAYFVGAAFIAAGISITTGNKSSLAATLLGSMFLLWVLILHLPRVIAAPHNGNEWTSGFVALAMSGCAFIFAGAGRRDRA